jgi:hypothetical protein
MVMSLEHQARQNQNIKRHNKSFEGVEQLKYLGSALTNHTSFMKKSRGD